MLTLIEDKKFIEVRHLLCDMNEVDIAEFIDELDDNPYSVIVFRLLPKELAADVFSYLDRDIQQRIVESITDRELEGILDQLFLDDTVDFLEEMPASIVKRVIKNSDRETRKYINQLLMYPEDSAGSLMTIEFMELDYDWTVSRAIAEVRRQCAEKESIARLFVTDDTRHLLGTVDFRDVLAEDDDTVIETIMDTGTVSANTHDDQADVAELFKKYDLVSMPVVDNEDRLVGIITIDDIVDVMEAEATEDIYKMAAMTPIDDDYLDSGVLTIAKKRVGWLLLLMVSATFTSMIISRYEHALAVCVALTAYIPMLTGTGGNSGSQASVAVIRGLSLGEIDFGDIFRVIWKELRVALVCGVALSACNFAKLMLLDRVGLTVALSVSLTLIVVVVMAKLVGCTLPLLAKKVGFDPAVMASPMITTIVDALALLIYFTVAMAIIPGVM